MAQKVLLEIMEGGEWWGIWYFVRSIINFKLHLGILGNLYLSVCWIVYFGLEGYINFSWWNERNKLNYPADNSYLHDCQVMDCACFRKVTNLFENEQKKPIQYCFTVSYINYYSMNVLCPKTKSIVELLTIHSSLYKKTQNRETFGIK